MLKEPLLRRLTISTSSIASSVNPKDEKVDVVNQIHTTQLSRFS